MLALPPQTCVCTDSVPRLVFPREWVLDCRARFRGDRVLLTLLTFIMFVCFPMSNHHLIPGKRRLF